MLFLKYILKYQLSCLSAAPRETIRDTGSLPYFVLLQITEGRAYNLMFIFLLNLKLITVSLGQSK